jgi:hypothetical protein
MYSRLGKGETLLCDQERPAALRERIAACSSTFVSAPRVKLGAPSRGDFDWLNVVSLLMPVPEKNPASRLGAEKTLRLTDFFS